MNSRSLRIMAVVLAFGAVLLGYIGLQLSAPPGDTKAAAVETAPPKPVGGETAIVALRAIDAGKPVTEADLAEVRVPVRRADAFGTVAEVVNRIPLAAIPAGEMLLAGQFQRGSRMARLLGPGERAVAIKVTEVIGGGGYVQPGDYVDVLLYLRGGNTEVRHSMARTLIEKVAVLAYGKSLASVEGGQVQDADGESSQAEAATRSAVLAVPRDEVEKLMLAENAGVIRLAVVSSDETGEPRSDGNGSITGLTELTARKRPARSYSVPVYRGTRRSFESVLR